MDYAHRVAGQGPVRLREIETKADGGMEREEVEKKAARAVKELVELQELMSAAKRHSMLVVLQGLDTSGKDGAIRNVTGPLNSQGCEVSSFKVPTDEERSHDFLWRIHRCAPALGQIKIFNRSHYEDVIAVRVHNIVPEEVWRARYEHINNFERLLADSGTIVLKFYLHISREEQLERLLKREQDATKFWKLSVGDWQERELWDQYTVAYEDAINHCNSERAPWFVVPADHKWFRNLALAEAMCDALRPLRGEWMNELEEVGRREKKEIEEFRAAH
jgi:PPK2 family polyphosphate:nucleotide phosphotransferase